MKHLLFKLLTLTAVFVPLLAGANDYYDFESDGVYYKILPNDPPTVEVSCRDEGYMNYSGSVTIPSSVFYDGMSYTVTGIGRQAFYNCYELTHVELPPTLEFINTYAFYSCSSLDNVVIPESVTWLGTYAFCHCSGPNFTQIVIPDQVYGVEYGAFYGCVNLTTVTIGSSVQYMGEDVFKNCSALTKVITQATTPPFIQNSTFGSEHYSNAQLWVPKQSLSAYQQADYWKNFSNISSMAYDFMEDGICYNITGNNPATVEVTYMTTDYNSYSGDVVVPPTVTHDGVTYTVTGIGNHAFDLCKTLTSISLPNTITRIGNNAFHNCQELTHVVIPNSVTTIDSNAFWICLKLEEAIIPNSVTTIGSMAFRNCTAMKRVVIGENVTSVGSTCFWFNPNITEVTCLSATPPTANDSGSQGPFMAAVNENAALRVPYDSHEAYRNHAVWGKFANVVSEKAAGMTQAGDVDGDGNVNIDDVTALIDILLSGAAAPAGADVDGDGNANIDDVTTLIDMLLGGNAGGGGDTGMARYEYLINSVPFTMINVDGGTFMMGLEGDNSAMPVHQVTVSEFSIGQTEVTQALWQTVMGSNPSYNKSDVNLPVENVDWNDCQAFVTRLRALTGRQFGLPTEAQWEFAARGGNKSQGYVYPGSNSIGQVAWYQSNSGGTTHIVATKAPNELGLYDMSGNVFEWCQDYWGSYSDDPQYNPGGPSTGEYRVCRSGAYNRSSSYNWFKCGGRTFDEPTTAALDTGLRISCRY